MVCKFNKINSFLVCFGLFTKLIVQNGRKIWFRLIVFHARENVPNYGMLLLEIVDGCLPCFVI